MNGTPRALNRVLLTLIGLLLLLVGTGLTLMAVVPAAGPWWQRHAGAALAWLRDYEDRTRLLVTSQSWIWLAAAAFFLLIVILMLVWIANQGKGRASTLLNYPGNADDDGAEGAVRLSCAVAENALKGALLERTDVFGVSAASYDFRQETALRVRVFPRQGVTPHEVAAGVAELVSALDELLGVEVPVLLSIDAGTRSRFSKAERVR